MISATPISTRLGRSRKYTTRGITSIKAKPSATTHCVSVAHPGCVDLWFPRKNVPFAASDVASCLLRNWVLIGCDQTAVHENGKGFGTNVIEIGSDDQGGFGKCPQCKMCLLFLKSKAIITFTVMNANLKHVRIVPTSHATCLRMLLTFFEVVLD